MPTLTAKVKQWRNAPLEDALTDADILHGPVNDYADYFADEHVVETGVVDWLDHPGTGQVPIHSIPGLSTSISGRRALSPALGEHSVEVLAELGLDDAAIAAAVEAGSVHLPNEAAS